MNLGTIGYAISKRVHTLLLAGIRVRNFILGKSDARKRFHAEFFTDRYIRKNFFPDFSYQGCMVEVGCATPELLSMSQHFRETGWRCIGVEPNPSFVSLHKARGNEVLEYAASDFEADDVEFTVAQSNAEYSDTDLSAHSFSSLKIKPEFMGYKNGVVKNYALTPIKVKVRKLDNILAQHCAEVTRVDILSVDVEGYELEVMKGFSPAKYGVKLIVLENLFHSPEYTEYMESIGYRLHSKIMYNYMYVPAEDAAPSGGSANPADATTAAAATEPAASGGDLRCMGWLVLAGLLCHGLLLTNDGVTWDGWYVGAWLAERYWREMYDFFASAGLPAYAWLNHLFAYAGNITGAFMVATVVCLIIQPPCVYALARRMGGLNKGEAFCLALLFAAMPLFTAAQELVMLYFVITHTFFFVACVAAARATDEVGWQKWPLHAFAVAAFMASFMNAALLVFYGGFFILLFFQWRRANPGDFRRDALRFISRHAVYLLLPPLAWWLRQTLAPQHGWYENYNNPLENLGSILPSIRAFFSKLVVFHIKNVTVWTFLNLGFSIPLALLVRWIARRGPAAWRMTCSQVKTKPLLQFGALLLLLAIFPFAAAGKSFGSRPVGDPSRYAILAGLPAAILLFGLLRSAFFRKPESGARWLAPVCAGLAVILGIQVSRVYLEERAVWIMSRSILHNALHDEQVKNSSVIMLLENPLSAQIVYGTYAFGAVFGSRDRLVTSTRPAGQKEFTPSEIAHTIQRTTLLPNSFNTINPAGQQIHLMVTSLRDCAGDFSLAMKYLRRRWFGSAEEMNEFLGSLTRLEARVMRPATKVKRLQPPTAEVATAAPVTEGVPFTNSLGMRMIPVAGTGWAARTETTQAQFEQMTGTNPSLFNDPSLPVERVTWDDAVNYCRLLSEVEARAGRLPNGMAYRLPTLAEHEKMAAGTDATQAVLAGETVHWQPEAAGAGAPNALGLCDVVGNVWEWTNDWGDKRKLFKVAAGGGFENTPAELKPHPNPPAEHYARVYALRLQGPIRIDYPDQAAWNRGFRCVLAPRL